MKLKDELLRQLQETVIDCDGIRFIDIDDQKNALAWAKMQQTKVEAIKAQLEVISMADDLEMLNEEVQ